MDPVATSSTSDLDVKIPPKKLLNDLQTNQEALMLRKCIHKMVLAYTNNAVFRLLSDLMGPDTQELPKTPPFKDAFSYRDRENRGGRARGRGRRGRGQYNIRGGRRAWGSNERPKISSPQQNTNQENRRQPETRRENVRENIQDAPESRELMRNDISIAPRQSMHSFFKDIDNLPEKERNHMIQVCIKELIEENKSLREANRRLVQKQRSFPPGYPEPRHPPRSEELRKPAKSEEARLPEELTMKKETAPKLHPEDVRRGKHKMNADAPEFQMTAPEEKAASSDPSIAPLPHELYENQNMKNEELRYQDLVRMRRDIEYEEMLAEQWYIEEMEARRHEMYGHEQGYGADPLAFDPRFFDEMAYHRQRESLYY